MIRAIAFIIILLISTKSFAQDTVQHEVLKLGDFIQLVLANHPVIRQAELYSESAEAVLRQARGHFDPKIEMAYDKKNFKDTEYYDIFNATLKFPTWLPVDPKVSFDRNEGYYLNPERTLPADNDYQQVSAGLSLPIGKGLFIDERRLALQQAKIYQDIAQAEQFKLANKILLKSIKDYWNWYLSYRKSLLLEQSIDIAEELFDRVVMDYSFGEASVVDTVQAKITYQSRIADYEKAMFELENSRLMLATHLWSPEELPLELQDHVIPDTLAGFGTTPTEEDLQSMITWAAENHPEIQKLDSYIEQLEAENRWNRESLKPEIDLSYSFIDAPINYDGELTNPQIGENYKLGIDFAFPLFLRKERGKLQLTQVKIQENTYELSQTQLQVKNNILSKYAETQMSGRLSEQYSDISQNYYRLLQAEILNLETGESDLFKLNIQQDKFLEARIKYFENQVKFEKNKAEILYEAGLPFLNLEVVE